MAATLSPLSSTSHWVEISRPRTDELILIHLVNELQTSFKVISLIWNMNVQGIWRYNPTNAKATRNVSQCQSENWEMKLREIRKNSSKGSARISQELHKQHFQFFFYRSLSARHFPWMCFRKLENFNIYQMNRDVISRVLRREFNISILFEISSDV